jgi:hypothetical protein
VNDKPPRTPRARHRMQLFDTPESLASTVATFLIDGFDKGGTLLLIARSRHREAIFSEFIRRGCFAGNGAAEERVLNLDAHDALARVSVNGKVDADLFDWTVGGAVRRLSAAGPLRVYCEMVEVLASHQDFDAAVQLETLWNRLGEQSAFTVLCGYSSAHFTPPAAQPVLRNICSCHTDATARVEDSLGRWLLNNARSYGSFTNTARA